MSGLEGASTLTCEECSTPEGCSEHRLFTCASCGKQAPWSDADDDERPNDCSRCWAKWRASRVEASPDTMAQVPRSWPPNTGCDPTTIVGGFGDQGSSLVSADLQAVTVAVAAERVRRDLVIRAVGYLDLSRYARQAGDNGSAEAALNASRRILLGIAGISDGDDTHNLGDQHVADA